MAVPTLREKRLLQTIVALLAAVPILAGAAGVILGPRLLSVTSPWPSDLDSHLRFLSAILFAMGLLWLSCVPAIERHTPRFRLLAFLTFAGGLARLLSLFLAGPPSLGHLYGLSAELVAVPLLVLWQGRVANGFSART